MADEELIIEALDEPEIEEDEHGLPIEKPVVAKPEIIAPEVGIEALRKQLDDEKVARREAEQRAAKAEEDAFTYQADNHDTNIRLLASSIEEKTRENAILKGALAEANAAGEYDKVAEIQVAISENSGLIGRFKEAHDTLSKTTLEPPKPAAPSDPVEAFAKQLTSRSAEWVRSHPDYVTNDKLRTKMVAAHNLTIADDIKADTPEYFTSLEKILGLGKAVDAPSVKEAENPLSSAAQEAPRVAPVSRGGNSKTVVTLSRAQREAAEASGMTDKEYATAMLALQKEGRLGSTH